MIPSCTTEEVRYSGTVHFGYQEKDGFTSVHTHYSNVHGVGIETGTKYVVLENDQSDTIINPNGDTMFRTVIHGKYISAGSDENTKVEITLINVIHPDGTETVLVEDAKVTCPGKYTSLRSVFFYLSLS